MQFSEAFPLKPKRAHEVCGVGAFVFAFALADASGGDVLWVREAWRTEKINPAGAAGILNPDRLLMAEAKDQVEVLAVAEEAARSGAVSLVVIEIGKPLSLTTGRRLQLAARDGKSTVLAIIPEGMGSNAAETRWRCAPVFSPSDSTLQHWQLIKNKSGTLGAWNVRWDWTSRRIHVVSPAGKRPGSSHISD